MSEQRPRGSSSETTRRIVGSRRRQNSHFATPPTLEVRLPPRLRIQSIRCVLRMRSTWSRASLRFRRPKHWSHFREIFLLTREARLCWNIKKLYGGIFLIEDESASKFSRIEEIIFCIIFLARLQFYPRFIFFIIFSYFSLQYFSSSFCLYFTFCTLKRERRRGVDLASHFSAKFVVLTE